jgi:hypothetical protein
MVALRAPLKLCYTWGSCSSRSTIITVMATPAMVRRDGLTRSFQRK